MATKKSEKMKIWRQTKSGRLSKQTAERNYMQKKRALVIEFLGGKCKRCGFTDERALQIDHVDGGGCKDRKTRYKNRAAFYRDVLDMLGNYQLLCANCNWIKRVENKEY